MPANFDFNSKGDQIDDAVIEPKRPIIDCHHHLWLAPESLITAMEQQDTALLKRLP